MKPKKYLNIKKMGNYLEIDGEWYFPTFRDSQKDGSMGFKHIDKRKLEETIEFVKQKLVDKVDTGMVLQDALGELTEKELEKLSDSLKTEKLPTIKKKYGCVNMEVNGVIIPLR